MAEKTREEIKALIKTNLEASREKLAKVISEKAQATIDKLTPEKEKADAVISARPMQLGRPQKKGGKATPIKDRNTRRSELFAKKIAKLQERVEKPLLSAKELSEKMMAMRKQLAANKKANS